jgi:hypothetical protein
VTSEQEWIEHRVRTYFAGMDRGERVALGRRVRAAIDDDGARRERCRRAVGLGEHLRRRPREGPSAEQICALFALSGPWSWQNIRGTDAEQAIERLDAERGRQTDRGAAMDSVRAVLHLTQREVRRRELAGAIGAAAEARGRAVMGVARQLATARSDELSRQWLAAIIARPGGTRWRRSRPVEAAGWGAGEP